MARWMALWLVLGGCSFLWKELTRPSFQLTLDEREYEPGQPIFVEVILQPEPGVSYRVALVDEQGGVAAQASLEGARAVTMSAPGPGHYDAQLQADGRMIAHLGITVR